MPEATEISVTVEAPEPTPEPTPVPATEATATEMQTVAQLAEAIGRLGAQVEALQAATAETQAQTAEALNRADMAIQETSSMHSTLAEMVATETAREGDDGVVEELPVVIPEATASEEPPAKTRGFLWKLILG